MSFLAMDWPQALGFTVAILLTVFVYFYVIPHRQLAKANGTPSQKASSVSPAMHLADTVTTVRPDPASRILSSQSKARERTLKRTTMADVRARYGYRIRNTGDTIPLTDDLCAIILKAKAGGKITRDDWIGAIHCSPNTLQRRLDAYQASKTVDTPDDKLSDAEFVEKYRRKPAAARGALPMVASNA